MKAFDFLSRKVDVAMLDPAIIALLQNASFKNLALYTAIDLIASTISKCEIKTFEDGKEVKGSLYYLLNVQPNVNEGATPFIYRLVDAIYREKGALVIMKSDELFLADGFTHEKNGTKEDRFRQITVGKSNLPATYKASDVFHFRLTDEKVIDLIEGVYKDYGVAIQSAVNAFTRNNGVKYKYKQGSVKAGDTDYNEKLKNHIESAIKPFIESSIAVYPEFEGTSLEVLEQGNSNSRRSTSDDVIAMRKDAFDLIAQVLHIPTPIIYGNITNIREIVNLFVTFGIDPLAKMISNEFTRKTATQAEILAGKKVVIDTNRVAHIDIVSMADKFEKLISSSMFSPDGALELVGLEPIGEPWSSQHYMTKNFALVLDVLNQMLGGENNE